MSFNRAMYDRCAYQQRLNDSSTVLNYTLNPDKFYNCNECRVPFGLVAGNAVSRLNGNLVDLESDLRNQTRQYSLCPELKYLPKCRNPGTGKDGLPCGPVRSHMESLHHLPNCQFIKYHKRPENVGVTVRQPNCKKFTAKF